MRIALINESSQVSKNALIYQVLSDVVSPLGHEVFNYGMQENDPTYELNYADAGLLAAILLNSHAVDFVVTGCGTGEGACIASNIYPNVCCGYVKDATDAYLFSQINHGNMISMPFAKEFGWCAELNLTYVFQALFSCEHGVGYPVDRGPVQKEFRTYFHELKNAVNGDMVDVLKRIDPKTMKKVIRSNYFLSTFDLYASQNQVSKFIRGMEQEVKSVCVK